MDVPTHQLKSASNRSFADWLQTERSESRDWSVTAYFYSALHLVDAYLHLYHARTPRNHQERKECMFAASPGFSAENRRRYKTLMDLSHRARYTELEMDETELRAADEIYAPLARWLNQALQRYRTPS